MEITEEASKAIGDIVARIQQGKVQLEGQLKATIAQKQDMVNKYNTAISEMTTELNDMNQKLEQLINFVPPEPTKDVPVNPPVDGPKPEATECCKEENCTCAPEAPVEGGTEDGTTEVQPNSE